MVGAVGLSVGEGVASEGDTEGLVVGEAEGLRVGEAVGLVEGAAVGLREGLEVGAIVVGKAVGLLVKKASSFRPVWEKVRNEDKLHRENIIIAVISSCLLFIEYAWNGF